MSRDGGLLLFALFVYARKSVFIGPSHKKIKFLTFFCRIENSSSIAIAVLKSPFIISGFVKDNKISRLEIGYEDDSSCQSERWLR
jgi:hypothetical protein